MSYQVGSGTGGNLVQPCPLYIIDRSKELHGKNGSQHQQSVRRWTA